MQLCLIIKERWPIPRRTFCNAHSIRRFALPAEGEVPYRGHAGDVPRNRTLDHSKGLAQELESALCLCRARSPRGGRHRRKSGKILDWLVLLSEAS